MDSGYPAAFGPSLPTATGYSMVAQQGHDHGHPLTSPSQQWQPAQPSTNPQIFNCTYGANQGSTWQHQVPQGPQCANQPAAWSSPLVPPASAPAGFQQQSSAYSGQQAQFAQHWQALNPWTQPQAGCRMPANGMTSPMAPIPPFSPSVYQPWSPSATAPVCSQTRQLQGLHNHHNHPTTQQWSHSFANADAPDGTMTSASMQTAMGQQPRTQQVDGAATHHPMTQAASAYTIRTPQANRPPCQGMNHSNAPDTSPTDQAQTNGATQTAAGANGATTDGMAATWSPGSSEPPPRALPRAGTLAASTPYGHDEAFSQMMQQSSTATAAGSHTPNEDSAALMQMPAQPATPPVATQAASNDMPAELAMLSNAMGTAIANGLAQHKECKDLPSDLIKANRVVVDERRIRKWLVAFRAAIARYNPAAAALADQRSEHLTHPKD